MSVLEVGTNPRRMGPLDPVRRAYETIFDYLAVSHEVTPSDAIVCFGSRDPLVPVRAADLYARGAAPVVVTTGGVPHECGRPEADVFAEELVKRGVPRQHIDIERVSRHTGENVALSMRLLRERRGRITSVVAVAWPLAARRCVATFARHHADVTVRSAPSFERPARHTPLSGPVARRALEQLDRLQRYSAEGTIAPVAVPSAVNAAAATLRRAFGDQLSS